MSPPKTNLRYSLTKKSEHTPSTGCGLAQPNTQGPLKPSSGGTQDMDNTACNHHEHRYNDGSQTPTERSANRSVEFVLLRGRPLFPQMEVQGKTQQTE